MSLLLHSSLQQPKEFQKLVVKDVIVEIAVNVLHSLNVTEPVFEEALLQKLDDLDATSLCQYFDTNNQQHVKALTNIIYSCMDDLIVKSTVSTESAPVEAKNHVTFADADCVASVTSANSNDSKIGDGGQTIAAGETSDSAVALEPMMKQVLQPLQQHQEEQLSLLAVANAVRRSSVLLNEMHADQVASAVTLVPNQTATILECIFKLVVTALIPAAQGPALVLFVEDLFKLVELQIIPLSRSNNCWCKPVQ